MSIIGRSETNNRITETLAINAPLFFILFFLFSFLLLSGRVRNTSKLPTKLEVVRRARYTTVFLDDSDQLVRLSQNGPAFSTCFSSQRSVERNQSLDFRFAGLLLDEEFVNFKTVPMPARANFSHAIEIALDKLKDTEKERQI
jgi:hypothetical protein